VQQPLPLPLNQTSLLHLGQLRRLSLAGCGLASLPEGLLAWGLASLDLNHNPLRCNCSLQFLLEAAQAGLELLGSCAAPADLHGRALAEVARRPGGDLECPAGGLGGLEVALLVAGLLLSLLLLLLAVYCWRRRPWVLRTTRKKRLSVGPNFTGNKSDIKVGSLRPSVAAGGGGGGAGRGGTAAGAAGLQRARLRDHPAI
jgi:hypothetical protein